MLRRSLWTGDLGGLRVIIKGSAVVASLILWLVLSGFAIVVMEQSLLFGVFSALVALAFHWVNVWVHHQGHYAAGVAMGHPLRHVVAFALIALDVYPPNEPTLPARTHVRRALGGPMVSVAFTGVLVGIAVPWFALAGSVWWPFLFLIVDNTLINVLGAMLPLKWIGIETDGDTLLQWWGKMEADNA